MNRFSYETSLPTGRPRGRWPRVAACLAAGALIVGCSSTAKRVPAPYAIELRADPKVNASASGRPSPVQVTIYELKSASTFQASDFFTLQADARAALGTELLNTEQVILRPGDTKVLHYPGNADARVVGVVAAYRDLEQSKWRLLVSLPEPQNTNIYKVWQFSPNEETVKVAVTRAGLEEVDRSRSWWPF
ncbi:type VI secretion system lipoprotein TssJ [Achromobacter sp. LC458]|jgi:type VI secretion system protein VasD|uniref:Type VI secretion system lipoprotein TssJ n=1 Tax=Achromobacter spanius TaxID=217203 RepID=A0A2S5GWN8_9BURK|nr:MULTISPECIES: type VI secretion system lipoprotein TssJ [Achromobacter]PPA77265.1 type VI secretion system lipoprotein TssJ [Achromobacter spanius]TRM50633.1 type VI secretion system lipoprotein TssJ [Achromobacter sp. LC458]HCQ45763.1 type VI secretion system lipoprotein TssJ [Achromobacter sp.]